MTCKILTAIPCFLGIHKLEIAQKLDETAYRISCVCCGRMFFYEDSIQWHTPWSAHLHKFYVVHGIDIVYKDWEGDQRVSN